MHSFAVFKSLHVSADVKLAVGGLEIRNLLKREQDMKFLVLSLFAQWLIIQKQFIAFSREMQYSRAFLLIEISLFSILIIQTRSQASNKNMITSTLAPTCFYSFRESLVLRLRCFPCL